MTMPEHTSEQSNYKGAATTYNSIAAETHYRSGTSSSTSSSVKFLGKDGNIEMGMLQISNMYMDCIGSKIPPIINKEILCSLREGIPYQYYIYALLETAEAPRPSFKYTRAIVNRLIQTGTSINFIEVLIDQRTDKIFIE